MAFGPFSSESRAKEVPTVVSDQAKAITGKGGQLTESGSISLGGKGAKFLEAGAADLSGVRGNVQLGGLNLAGATGTTITSTDADLARSFQESTAGVNARLTDLLKDATHERSSSLGGLSEALADANKQTGKRSQRRAGHSSSLGVKGSATDTKTDTKFGTPLKLSETGVTE